MQSNQLTGRLYSATPTEQKTDKLKVRTFILDCTETTATGETYQNYAQFQLVNNNCDILNGFQPGQPVKVSFNVKGNFWQDKCITNLNAWKIEAIQAQQPAPAPAPAQQQQWPQQTQAMPTPNQWTPAPAPAQQQWTQPTAQPQQQQWGAPQQQDNQNLPF